MKFDHRNRLLLRTVQCREWSSLICFPSVLRFIICILCVAENRARYVILYAIESVRLPARTATPLRILIGGDIVVSLPVFHGT